jgi:hypothetical protein
MDNQQVTYGGKFTHTLSCVHASGAAIMEIKKI